MKKIVYIPLFLLVIIINACNKKEVAAPDFSVTLDPANTYKAGENVKFIFSGNPNNITFWSGETGKQYEFRDRVNETATTSVRTDIGVPLKNMSTRMDSYSYIYTAAGTYKVTFVASNTTVYGSKTDVKELEITIEP
ncbi:DUF5017 domain-containing protein [Pedobacter sp. BS3]|uniref:DUF5017 domain-containing protein n=1 Tax=Pedobacter sp. BS3 TaxID=2567937 RepID=UPI001658DC42|nr:DUF5017 domain-containing protein [Pedobacter sp. BS3]